MRRGTDRRVATDPSRVFGDGNTLSPAALYLIGMRAPEEKLPPPKDGPPVTEPKNRKPNENEIDIDDAMIEEPPEEDVESNDPKKAPSR
jgi:hypothetical protein